MAPNIRLHNWTVDDDIFNCSVPHPPPLVCFRIVLSGEVRCEFQPDLEIDICGPSLCVLAPAERCPNVQLLGGRGRLRLVGIDFHGDPASENWPVSLSTLIAGFQFACPEGCPILLRNIGQDSLTAVATQIATCPFQALTRELYLTGMAFQLIALAMDFVATSVEPQGKGSILSSRDLERVDCVKCILRDRCRHPPSLEQLARSVGIGPKRLTSLFRQECGVGITNFLQDYRLEQAFHLLAHTNLQIGEVAYQVGYSPAHFSTAFKKRFGRQPNELRSAGSQAKQSTTEYPAGLALSGNTRLASVIVRPS